MIRLCCQRMTTPRRKRPNFYEEEEMTKTTVPNSDAMSGTLAGVVDELISQHAAGPVLSDNESNVSVNAPAPVVDSNLAPRNPVVTAPGNVHKPVSTVRRS
jgi:hypothetical protein